MGINSPIMWGVNCPNNGGLLQQKCESCAGQRPRIVCYRRGRLRTRSCSDSCLKWDARFLRPASEMERQVALTCDWHGTQSYWDSHWMGQRLSRTRAYSGPRLKSLCFLGREVHILIQNATFILKWGLRLMTYPWWFLESLQHYLMGQTIHVILKLIH